MAVLVGLLAGSWYYLDLVELFLTAGTVSSRLVAHLMAYSVIVVAFWMGCRAIFADRRDDRSLGRLLVSRPLRTPFWWCITVGSAIFAGGMAGFLVLLIWQPRLLAVSWWQAIGGVTLLAMLTAGMLEDAYGNLYA